MIWWQRTFKQKLVDLKIENDLLERYIDDVNLVVNSISPGTKYENGRLTFNHEKEDEDRKLPNDKVSMEIIKDIANSIHDMIEFTVDVPSNYADGKMPVLDRKI